jgi:hypothetical protein
MPGYDPVMAVRARPEATERDVGATGRKKIDGESHALALIHSPQSTNFRPSCRPVGLLYMVGRPPFRRLGMTTVLISPLGNTVLQLPSIYCAGGTETSRAQIYNQLN